MAALDSSLATAAALLVMFGGAADAVFTVARAALAPRWFGLLARVAVGLYAGWVTAAFFLNLSTALVAAEVADAADLGWQLGVLGVAGWCSSPSRWQRAPTCPTPPLAVGP